MLSTDITDTPAYSGKLVVTLIGMDMEGKYVGVKVIKHSEPILLLGIPESALLDFNAQYIGKSVKDKIEVGQTRPDEGVLGVDAISGATVTVIVQNQVNIISIKRFVCYFCFLHHKKNSTLPSCPGKGLCTVSITRRPHD